MHEAKKIWAKPIAFGIIAALLLLLAYFGILTVLNSFAHAVQNFFELWYFMVPLVIGFGLQIALFTYIRNAHKLGLCESGMSTATSGASTAASGTVSTASMVACCAHHVTDVAPLLGVTAAVVFFDKFQNFFMLLGIVSSALGLFFMLRTIQKHSLYSSKQKFFSWLMEQKLDDALQIVFVVGVALLVAVFLLSM